MFDLSDVTTEVKIFLPPVKSNCSQLNGPACGRCSNMFTRRVFLFVSIHQRSLKVSFSSIEIEPPHIAMVEGENKKQFSLFYMAYYGGQWLTFSIAT